MSAIKLLFSDSLKNEKNWTLMAFLFKVLSVFSVQQCIQYAYMYKKNSFCGMLCLLWCSMPQREFLFCGKMPWGRKLSCM